MAVALGRAHESQRNLILYGRRFIESQPCLGYIPMKSRTSQIPVGSGFNPNLYDFRKFLKALVDKSGYKDKLIAAIWSPDVRIKPLSPTKRSASLPLEAAIQYGLLDADYKATDLCLRLQQLESTKLYEEFARHILHNLGGLRVVEAIEQMQQDGHDVKAASLRQWLTKQGFYIPKHNTGINSLRLWLVKAGLFPKARSRAWQVSVEVKQRLVGLDDNEIASLVDLRDDQQQFVLALCARGAGADIPAAEIRDLAHARSGIAMKHSSLPKEYLEPLKRLGFIDYESQGTSGGKTSTLSTTDKFNVEVLEPFLSTTIKSLDATLAAHYRKSLDDIYSELDSNDKHTKGLALEAFAIQVMRLLGLRFVAWRKRARDETGHAEVDIILSGLMGGVATRWQVQCKNTPSGRLSLEDVAREIGLTFITKATHVLFIANCRATRDAMAFADEVMRNSPLCIMILDKEDFDLLRESRSVIGDVIRAKSRSAAELRRHGLDWQSS